MREAPMHDAHQDRPRTPKLGGFVPFSSCDYPGHLACVVFTAGCPWRCRYCHNPHLQKREHQPGLPSWDDILAWLPLREGLLDGLVFCGGEPLAEPLLPRMAAQVKALGFKVGLHTGGAYPDRLQACLPYVDWVGFDVKHQFDLYPGVTLIRNSGDPARRALAMVQASGVPFECRTTTHPGLHSPEQLRQLADQLAGYGVRDFALQLFRSDGCHDDALLQQPALPPDAATLAHLENAFERFTLRG
ncbi:anaerobic ribonucleoside-triphosphate reductase activating protein [Chitiniphilus shinanonensis]